MEPHRAFTAPRVLLPSEIELIEALGLTEEDYWEFLRINYEYTGKRRAEYEVVPDVKNETATIIAVVSLVIGLASTAVSLLLAPKPRTPDQKERRAISSDDINDNRRFAPQAQFDSLQQLSNLGATIPLVYTRRRTFNGVEYGGVRVNSTLLWSLMTTLGRGQQFRGLMLFSHGEVEGRPDFGGYAIGDLLLENYALGKLSLYFSPGTQANNRITIGDVYTESESGLVVGNDPFAFKYGFETQQYFSGARTPSTQTVFGTYACMPNGNRFKVDYELLLKPRSQQGDVEDDIRAKQRKIRTTFPRFAYIYGPGNITSKQVFKGDEVIYSIAPNEVLDPNNEFGDITDVQRGVNDARFNIDSNLIVGDTYLIGTGYGICINKENSPWEVGKQVTATFKMTTDAVIDTREGNFNDKPNNLTIQRVAVGTVSNNRVCDRTDLIIKSTVFRKINGFANVNAQPSRNTIERYEDEDGTINIGRMTIYSQRLSFFALQYRKKGETTWTNITPENTCFVVPSRTPEAVYNKISIYHPSRDAYEYQLAPLAGAAVARFFAAPGSELMLYWLNAAGEIDAQFKQPAEQAFSKNGFSVFYTGYQKPLIQSDNVSKEWEIYDGGDPEFFYGDVDSYGTTVNLRYGAAWEDFKTYPAEELSNDNGPEHEVVAVNEILVADNPAEYTDLSYAGIRLNSGAEWTSFSELSAYFKTGIKITRLAEGGTGASNLLPDIAYDLLTNTKYGVGEMVGPEQVDRNEMEIASKFCSANGLFWDGVIPDRVNIREWMFENAAYCLLQFRIKGGRFSLFPDVPYLGSGEINYNEKIAPKALFTDGNMQDLSVSFLSPEERQIFKAVALYREEESNGFPQTKTVVVSLIKDENGVERPFFEQDPEETFDLSTFCTSKDHAILFAKYALKIRQLVDHGIKFQTTPQMAAGLEPGDYFQVASTASHPTVGSSASRLNNGSITSDGTIVGLALDNGSYAIQYWTPGTSGLGETTITVSGGKVTGSSPAKNALFALSISNNPQTRVYKVESLTHAEDGLVELAGSFTPLNSQGQLQILDWGNDPFKIIGE